MKPSIKAFFLFLILFWTTCSYSQIIVNAGKDTSFCNRPGTTMSLRIGGNPTAKGGVAPYKYQWTASYIDYHSKKIKFNNNLFNNDTIANPTINLDTFVIIDDLIFKFIVNVIDNNKNNSTDSITVAVSSIAFTTLVLHGMSINDGDTCQLKAINIINGFPPLKYIWSPDYNISNISADEPFAWPVKYTQYSVEVTDSIGCKGSDFVDVDVNSVGIRQLATNSNYSILNNPIRDNSILNFDFNIVSGILSIYDYDGKVIYVRKINSNTVEIGKIIKTPGIYIFTIEMNNEIITRGKLLKE